MSTKLRQFSMAIGNMEGYYVTQQEAAARRIPFPTLPQRLFNPGDLIYVGQHKATPFSVVGADKKTRVYCKFQSEVDGFAACDFQVTLYANRSLTVQQTINKWAPADDGNNPHSYTAGVCRIMKCKPTDLLYTVIGSVPIKMSLSLHGSDSDQDPGYDAAPGHFPNGYNYATTPDL